MPVFELYISKTILYVLLLSSLFVIFYVTSINLMCKAFWVFFHLYCCILFHCMNILMLIYLCYCSWAVGCFSLGTKNKNSDSHILIKLSRHLPPRYFLGSKTKGEFLDHKIQIFSNLLYFSMTYQFIHPLKVYEINRCDKFSATFDVVRRFNFR